MIYTLTTNPAIDMTVHAVNGVHPNTVSRTDQAAYSPNGKGLNVSFVLAHFGVPSTVLGFFGGFSGRYIVEECQRMGQAIAPIWVEEPTRINLFVNDGEQEYKLVNAGSFVPPEAQEALLAQLRAVPDADLLSVSGSLPRGITPDYYDRLLTVCAERGIRTVLDISSPHLKDLLAFHPFLIKPNDEELSEIFGTVLRDEQDAVAALDELHARGAQNVLLTLGGRGSYFSGTGGRYRAGVYPVRFYSSTCCGDACLAAFLSVYTAHPDRAAEALRLSAAVGADVAESAGLGTLSHAEEYAPHIPVTPL